MKELQQTYRIAATPDEVWQALVDPAEIEGWGAGPAVMNDQVGTEFKLWGDGIWGKNIEVVPGKRLVQEWYDAPLPEPTIATITLESEDNGTILELHHANIPDDRAEDIEEGWKIYYLGPLKEYVEAQKNL